MEPPLITLVRGWQIVSVKNQMVTILGFEGHMVSVAITQFCHYSIRGAIYNMYKNEYGYILIKLYSQKQAGYFWPLGLVFWPQLKYMMVCPFLQFLKLRTDSPKHFCQRWQASCFWWTVGGRGGHRSQSPPA